MQYTPRIVANALLAKAARSGAVLSPMKVQKLVFYIHAWSLAFYDESFLSERPEPWPYGPVFDSLYHDLKNYGQQPVTSMVSDFYPATGQMVPLVPNQTDTAFWNLLDQVWERYACFSALKLSELTHERGGPWDLARQEFTGVISDELIRDFYKAKLQQHGPSAY